MESGLGIGLGNRVWVTQTFIIIIMVFEEWDAARIVWNRFEELD